MAKPLYPEHGMEYDIAMMEAEEEYQRWVNSRKKNKFTMFTRKEKNDADL